MLVYLCYNEMYEIAMKKTPNILTYLFALLLASCVNDKPKELTLFSKINQENSNINFENTVIQSKDFNILNYRNFYNGGGVAIGDINNDGLDDVYLTGNMVPNKLYLNEGNFSFKDISETSKTEGKKAWSTGVVMVDINADGWLDIYVCNAGFIKGSDQKNELFINNQDGTFTEKAAAYNLDNNGFSTHAAFFDMDNDGDLDVYILNNSFLPVNSLNYSNKRELPAEEWPVKDFVKGGGDKIFRNDGGVFTDITKSSGIYTSLIGFGLGITVGDLNNDNYPDLYVSNDFFERDYLYINQQNGTFKEELTDWMNHISNFSMGADMADINNDGFPEIFVTDMLADDDIRLKKNTVFEEYNVYNYKQKQGFYEQFMQNTLQVNNQDGSFSEVANMAGVSASDWSWGALMFDADNDGYKDIFVSNGIGQDVINQDFIDFFANDIIQKMVLSGKKEEVDKVLEKMPSEAIPNAFYHNSKNLNFKDKAVEFGLDDKTFSNGSAFGDLDNDGDLDLVVNNVNQPALLYRNNSDTLIKNNFIGFKLNGNDQNKNAIGAKINAYHNGAVFYLENIPTRGFQSSISYKNTIGLGEIEQLDSVKIIWPDGKKTVFNELAVNQYHEIAYEPTLNNEEVSKNDISTLLKEKESTFSKLKEDRYIDFFNEGLIYKMLSKEGPAMAKGDFNGDGNLDIFIGGATDQFASLWLSDSKGKFEEKKNILFEKQNQFEDVAAVAFDVDNDGDQDIFIGSGGNNIRFSNKALANRLYLNDGKGNFTLGDVYNYALFNTAKVLAHDFNGDGFQDVFVGERSIKGKFGLIPKSSILLNDGKGNLRPAKNVIPELSQIGMVTNAKMVNLVGDEKLELVITLDWGVISVFEKDADNKWNIKETNLSQLEGWWNTVESADLNNDGLQDLILGNHGGNCYLMNQPENELLLWVHDFDGNGGVEKIMTRKVNGKNVPVPMKKELIEQLPFLKKQSMMHDEYAKKGMIDLFGKEVISQLKPLSANNFQSIVAYNKGDGKFDIHKLPPMAQVSSTNAISIYDFNKDGFQDIILAGNDFSYKPQFGRLDASYGQILINENGKSFKVLPQPLTGLSIKGEVKHIVKIADEFIFVRNDDKPLLFEMR